MILFNLILTRQTNINLSFSVENIRSTSQINTCSEKKTYKYTKKVGYVLPKFKIVTETTDDFSTKSLVKKNLLQRINNKIWQQTIFLSVPTKLSEKYTSQLEYDNLVIDKKQQKKLLSQFSKDLLRGRIETYTSKNLSAIQSSSFLVTPSVKYVWKKGVNVKLDLILKLWQKNLSYRNQNYRNFLSDLKFNQFPIFTLINKWGQIVISEPPEELLINKSIFDRLYRWYIVNLMPFYNFRPVYQGWFFVNYEDAKEYFNYIKQNYPSSQSNNQLSLFTCNLEVFYKMSRKFSKLVQFRLIPDLNEVGKLVNTYKNYQNVSFDKKQVYGKNYFQGQPIYILDNYISYQTRIDQLNKNFNQAPYIPIFTTYNSAIKSIQKNSKMHLDTKPKLRVYNLEDFLSDQSKRNAELRQSFLIIPSKSTYQMLKLQKNCNKESFLLLNKLINFPYIKLCVKRIISSLVSRKP